MTEKLLNLGRVLNQNELKQVKAGYALILPGDHDECDDHCHYYDSRGYGYCYQC